MSNNNNKTLIIVESNAKGRKIQKFLGDNFIVKASYGHVLDLGSVGKWNLGIDLDKDFQPTYVLIPDKKDKLQAIVQAAAKADKIVLASDPDREGEAIACHLASKLKNHLNKITRAEFYEITPSGIKKGLSETRDLDYQLYDAQQARRALDRIVGYLVSHHVIKHFGKKLSAGRVQSVATKIIVDRELEIEAFQAEKYWNLHATLKNPNGKLTAKYTGKITSEAQAKQLVALLEKDSFQVADLTSEIKVVKPPAPFTTATMLQSAAKAFKMNSARATKAAQSLYEAGLITYIRTDSVRTAPEAIQAARNWLQTNSFKIPKQPNVYQSGGNNVQDAHEAIRPTDVTKDSKSILVTSADEKSLYTLIRERFLASQMLPAKYDMNNVLIKSGQGYEFKTQGKALKQEGWLSILTVNKPKDKDLTLPTLTIKENLDLTKPGIVSEAKQTQPPSRYKEHSLIEELKKKGIGRPSTYASIMSKITARNYVTQKNNSFHATDLGKQVIDNLSQFFQFMNYQYTAELENKLDQIAEGKLTYKDMLSEFYFSFQKELMLAGASLETDYGIDCPKCQMPMRLKHGQYGYYMSCSDFVNCRATLSCDLKDGKPVVRPFANKPIVKNQNCPKCGSEMYHKIGPFGPFYSCITYPKCRGARKVIVDKLCGKCEKHKLYITCVQEELKLSCTGYPECSNLEELPSDMKVEWINPKTLPARPRKAKSKKSAFKDLV